MIDQRGIIERHAGPERIALIAKSYARLTGRELVPSGETLWMLPAVVVAHGTEPDPIFFYANRAALTLFEFPADEFIRLPSRLSAPPADRAERARLFEQLAARDFIDDYAGVRTARSGGGFRIERATVWNLVDPKGSKHGQAATFGRWSPVPLEDGV